MKLLIVLPRFPYPLEKGDQLRAYHQIKSLSKHYQVYVFCLSEKKIPTSFVKELEPYCASICIAPIGNVFRRLWQFFRMFKNGAPLQCAYFYSQKAKRKFDGFFESVNPDIVLCQLVRMVQYVKDKDVFKVLDYQDVFSHGMLKRYQYDKTWKRRIWKYEHLALVRAEKEAYDLFDLKTIISEQDRSYLPLDVYKQEKVEVWRNGVDVDYFQPIDNPLDCVSSQEGPCSQRKFDIVFTGNMGYTPNEDAAEFLVKMLLPKLNSTEISILIAGTSPTHLVRSLASDKVNVTGWIRDIRKAYACGKIFVAPMRLGTGMQNKLLEAMACGLPCIASQIAVKGLGTYEECPVIPIDIYFENDIVPKELVDNVLILLADEKKREELGRKGREFVANYYTWSAQAELFTKWIANR